jgi:hypothetical protein
MLEYTFIYKVLQDMKLSLEEVLGVQNKKIA